MNPPEARRPVDRTEPGPASGCPGDAERAGPLARAALPGPMAPMLAGGPVPPFDDPLWVFEVKWDGYRALAYCDPAAGSARVLSRTGRDLTPAFPALRALGERVAGPCVLDGEIVAVRDGRPDFEALRAGGAPQYVAFDCLWRAPRDLRDAPWEARRAALEAVVRPGGPLHLPPAVPEQGRALFDAVRRRGLEGVMAKRRGSPYRSGVRTRDWLKIKNLRRGQAVLCGYTTGGGRVVDGVRLGAFVLGAYDGAGRLVYVGHVGTGFSADELRAILARLTPAERPPFEPPLAPEVARAPIQWVRPDQVCAIEYTGWTAGQRLRHPSYQGLRPDTSPETCTVARLARGGSGAGAPEREPEP